MSIAKRVAEAVEKMAQDDAEGALIPISIAIDATASKHFKCQGRKCFKEFIHDNLGLITKVGFGPSILNINLKYDHPHLEPNPDGLCSIEDIFYHVVRCGLLHAGELPSTLKFVNEYKFQVEDGLLVLPSSLIYGLIAAVVVCPEKLDQTIPDNYALNIRGFEIKLNILWGKKQELENLYSAMDAIMVAKPKSV